MGLPRACEWTASWATRDIRVPQELSEGTPTARSDRAVGLELKWMHLAPMVGRNADFNKICRDHIKLKRAYRPPAARSGELPDQAAAADRAVAPRVAETP